MSQILESHLRALADDEALARLADFHDDPAIRYFARRLIDEGYDGNRIEELEEKISEEAELIDLQESVRKAIKDSADRDSLVDALEELL